MRVSSGKIFPDKRTVSAKTLGQEDSLLFLEQGAATMCLPQRALDQGWGWSLQRRYVPLTGKNIGPFSLQVKALYTEPNWLGKFHFFKSLAFSRCQHELKITRVNNQERLERKDKVWGPRSLPVLIVASQMTVADRKRHQDWDQQGGKKKET